LYEDLTMATATKIDHRLTMPQRRVYEFMLRFQARHGLPPTMKEIAAALKVNSPSNVRAHILALVSKGRATAHPRGVVNRYVAIPDPKA
jgi:SOS-response transcriptional repressor LexA